MKRLLLIALAFCLIASPCLGCGVQEVGFVGGGNSTSGGGDICTSVHETNGSDITTTYKVNYSTDYYFAGQIGWDAGSSDISICKIEAVMDSAGDITDRTFSIEIREYGGTNCASSAITNGTSNGVIGGSWTDTKVTYTFATAPAIDSTKTYCILIKSTGSPSTSVNGKINKSAAGGLSGVSALVKADGTRSTYETSDCKFTIYKE